MENEVKIFENNGRGISLPVKEVGGQVYFEAEASAIGLGISQIKNGKVYVRWENVSKYLSQHVGKGDWITEPQFYKLAFKASNDIAEKFQEWVASEVLPSIRKHGAYMTDAKAEAIVTDKSALADLLQQAADQLKAKDLQIAELKPKALFADSVAASKSTVLVGELAKILRGNGVDIGANRLFAWMRENGYLISRKGSDWNMPTQRAMDMGLFKIKETTINHSNGVTTVSKTPKVTGKGQQYFINKLLKKNVKSA
jgi:anti-repressor protein